MIYEMRIYYCVPGKLPDLLKRFDTITLKLWEKHQIRQAGFWTTLIVESPAPIATVALVSSGLVENASAGEYSVDGPSIETG